MTRNIKGGMRDMDKKTYSILIRDGADNEAKAREAIKAFNGILSSYGVSLRLNYSGVEQSNMIILSINEEWSKQRLKRNAGRHKATTTYQCKEIKQWQSDGMTTEEIIEKLDMSRSTYFRHLKRWKEHGNDERFF
jgi:DNA-binding CsgD family transcriptional regulator